MRPEPKPPLKSEAKPALKPVPSAKGAPEKPPAEKPPAKRSGAKLVVAAGALFILGGGTAVYFVLEEPAAEGRAAEGAAQTRPATPSRPPVFVPLDAFTVNLMQADPGLHDQYLQVGLTLRVADQAQADAVKLHMPEIRNRVLLLLSGKRAAEIATVPGKQALAQEILEATNKTIGEGSAGVSGVLFTAFVIQ